MRDVERFLHHNFISRIHDFEQHGSSPMRVQRAVRVFQSGFETFGMATKPRAFAVRIPVGGAAACRRAVSTAIRTPLAATTLFTAHLLALAVCAWRWLQSASREREKFRARVRRRIATCLAAADQARLYDSREESAGFSVTSSRLVRRRVAEVTDAFRERDDAVVTQADERDV